MRVGVLADKKVGKFIMDNFVSTWKKVGTFTILKHETKNEKTTKDEGNDSCDNLYFSDGTTVTGNSVGVNIKVGGNVATYFCTPEGLVIHAIAGVVSKETFLKEAKWAVRIHSEAKEQVEGNLDKMKEIIATKHKEKITPKQYKTKKSCSDSTEYIRAVVTLNVANSKIHRIHRLLADKPLPTLASIYKHVFEKILGEKVSDQDVKETSIKSDCCSTVYATTNLVTNSQVVKLQSLTNSQTLSNLQTVTTLELASK